MNQNIKWICKISIPSPKGLSKNFFFSLSSSEKDIGNWPWISCTQRKPPASLCNVLPSDTHWASYLPVDTTYMMHQWPL